MIIKKEVVVPERTEIREVSICCDWCKTIAKHGLEWAEEEYDSEEITIKYEASKYDHYDNGGSKSIYNLDLCPNCFKDKLIPLLHMQGVEIKKEEVIW